MFTTFVSCCTIIVDGKWINGSNALWFVVGLLVGICDVYGVVNAHACPSQSMQVWPSMRKFPTSMRESCRLHWTVQLVVKRSCVLYVASM